MLVRRFFLRWELKLKWEVGSEGIEGGQGIFFWVNRWSLPGKVLLILNIIQLNIVCKRRQ